MLKEIYLGQNFRSLMTFFDGGIKLDGNGIFFSVISLPRKNNLGICFGLVHSRIMTFVLEVTKKPIGSPIFPFSSFRPVNFHFWAEVAELYDVWCIYWLDLPPHPVTVTLFFPFPIIMQHVDPLPESLLLLQISSLRVPLTNLHLPLASWGWGGSRSNFFESQKPAPDSIPLASKICCFWERDGR